MAVLIPVPRLFPLLLLLAAACLFPAPVQAQEKAATAKERTTPAAEQVVPAQQASAAAPAPPDADAALTQARQQLQDIYAALDAKRKQIAELNRQLKATRDAGERSELEQQIAQEEAGMTSLRQSFDNVALGGVDLGVFDPDRAAEDFNWQSELLLVLKPLFQELKQLTEKPRQIERLNVQLADLETQLRVARRALLNIERLRDDGLDKTAATRLETLRQSWAQRVSDIQRQQEIAQLQLGALLEEDETVLEQLHRSTREFISGRGANLALAVGASLLVWFILRGLLALYTRLGMYRIGTARGTGRRVFLYIYQALSVLLAAIAALLVLYVTGDIVLLVLAMILVVVMLLGLRNYLPRFMEETKLLLNIGSVRERERVIYNGLPWLVRSLGVYSRLYNPALEGLLRLPMSEMIQLVSRPFREDEPWFPTTPGDWVTLADGTVGQVLRQTPELVQLRVRGSPRTLSTTSFLSAQPQNLSQGYGVRVTFGIDYSHQAIATTTVPGLVLAGVRAALEQSKFAEHLDEILVEFQDAGSSSLNYLIYVTMKGAAADGYYAVQRIVQNACVDLCNAQGWVIPFNQLTVHAGTGFAPAGPAA
jgi:hypothetical protein